MEERERERERVRGGREGECEVELNEVIHSIFL